MSRLYFAYGSNMKRSRLEDGRVGEVADHGVTTLKDYRIAFNKQSTDGTGKTNLMPTEQQDVLGVLYGLSDEQLKTLDGIENGYVRIPLSIEVEGKATEVQTYVALEERINNDLLPTAEYLGYLIDGAVEHNFPTEYQEFLKGFEVCK